MARYGISYTAMALVLKAFSFNSATRRLYRFLGNSVGQGLRKRRPATSRIRKAEEIQAAIEKFAPFDPDSHLFELGTGWMHWYALSLQLHHPGLRATTFDVWDNRQFDALQIGLQHLRAHYESQPDPPPQVLESLATMQATTSFDDLYDVMAIDYRIDAAGSLHHFADGSMSHIISADVLEHVAAEDAAGLVHEMYRLLRPSGVTLHQIATDDHLTHFDRSRSEKEYLRFPERRWRRWYQNRVQYFNRIQASQWLEMFENAGFECLDMQRLTCDVDSLDIAEQYRDVPQGDLECTRLTIVHRKPVS